MVHWHIPNACNICIAQLSIATDPLEISLIGNRCIRWNFMTSAFVYIRKFMSTFSIVMVSSRRTLARLSLDLWFLLYFRRWFIPEGFRDLLCCEREIKIWFWECAKKLFSLVLTYWYIFKLRLKAPSLQLSWPLSTTVKSQRVSTMIRSEWYLELISQLWTLALLLSCLRGVKAG